MKVTSCFRTLPLVIVMALAATAVPMDIRTQYAPPRFVTELSDVIANLVLYAPIGAGLAAWPLTVVAILAFGASACIEALQGWFVGRYPAPIDVVTNMAGAVIGAGIARAWPSVRRLSGRVCVSRVGATAALIALLALFSLWSKPVVTTSALSDWNPAAPLLAGNEATADRPWSGTVRDVTIVAKAVPRGEAVRISGLARPDPIAGDAVAVVQPGPLRLTGRAERLADPAAAARLAAAATAANAVTIVARVRPADVTQRGPARIVSFSTDPYRGNFMLGQDATRLVFRVRTPVSGPNGADVDLVTADVLAAGTETMVVASYDGRVARVYADGRDAGRANLFTAGCAWRPLCGWGQPVAGGAAGVLASVAAIAWWPSGLAGVRPAGIAAAALTGMAIGRFEAVSAAPPWIPWIPVLAGVMVAAAFRSGARAAERNED